MAVLYQLTTDIWTFQRKAKTFHIIYLSILGPYICERDRIKIYYGNMQCHSRYSLIPKSEWMSEWMNERKKEWILNGHLTDMRGTTVQDIERTGLLQTRMAILLHWQLLCPSRWWYRIQGMRLRGTEIKMHIWRAVTPCSWASYIPCSCTGTVLSQWKAHRRPTVCCFVAENAMW